MEVNSAGGAGRRMYGVVIGVVTDNKHPEGEYRVKVKFPWMRSSDAGDKEDFISTWARIATPMAGKGRGLYLLPEPDDEVLVAFEHGDLRRPYVVGALWNGKDVPPVNDQSAPNSTDPMGVDLNIEGVLKDNKKLEGKNRSRFFESRSGHLLLFDDSSSEKDEKVVIQSQRGHVVVLNDKKGNESIALYDSTGEEYVYLDEKNKKITFETKNGDIDMLCKNGTFNLVAKNIETEAKKDETRIAKSNMTHEAKGTLKLKGGPKVDVDGGKIELN